MEFAERVRKIPPYVFARIDELKKDKESSGTKVISFGVGDPDLPPPPKVLKSLHESSVIAENHKYPPYAGSMGLRKAIAQWYEMRFGVSLDPATEVLVLCGSKEGLAHMPQAFINPGDGVLVPSPGYPVYQNATILAGGIPIPIPQREEKGFLPDLEIVDRKSLDKSKMLFLNFPCNPTAAVADESFFEYATQFAKKRELVVCHDNAYSEIYYDQKRPPSFLQIKGAKDNLGVEFHSFSKTFNMAGFRLGFVVGNKKVIEGLAKVKTNIDSGAYLAIQQAGIVALEDCWKDCDNLRKEYQARRDFLCSELKKLKFQFQIPQASFYVWCKVPAGFNSESFTEYLIKEAGVLVTPGTGFGPEGQGYVRFSMTLPLSEIKIGVERMSQVLSGSSRRSY